jgi:hypothetical protein
LGALYVVCARVKPRQARRWAHAFSSLAMAERVRLDKLRREVPVPEGVVWLDDQPASEQDIRYPIHHLDGYMTPESEDQLADWGRDVLSACLIRAGGADIGDRSIEELQDQADVIEALDCLDVNALYLCGLAAMNGQSPTAAQKKSSGS